MAKKGAAKRAAAARKKANSYQPPKTDVPSSPEPEEKESDEEQRTQMSLLEKLDNLSLRLTDLDKRVRVQLENSTEVKLDTPLFCRPIGFIKSAYPEKTGTPRQGMLCPDVRAELTIEKDVFTNADHSLDGLEGFTHIWLLFWFHKNKGASVKAKVKPPRLEGKETKGVFATRSPHRPNPLGLSLVRLDQVVGDKLYITGVDLVDGTPVLDVKPFIDPYDVPVHTRNEVPTPSWVTLADTDLPSLNTVEFTSYALRKLKLYHSRCADGCEYCLKHIDDALLYAAMRELLKTDLRSRYRRHKCSDRIQIVVIDNLKVSIWYDGEGNVHVLNLEPRQEGEVLVESKEDPETETKAIEDSHSEPGVKQSSNEGNAAS